MNKAFGVVWSELKNTWVVVSEITKACGKRSAAKLLLAPLLLAATAALAGPAAPPAPTTLPSGGVVNAGNATITQTVAPGSAVMNVNQGSQRATVNWDSFNLGSSASVNFNQPNAQAVTLNRVLDSNPSQIFGKINAPGQVYLINPGGIYFSPTASVDVNGFVATTHSMSDAAFMAGSTTFQRNGATGSVVNEGELRARLDGYIALLAPNVVNQGLIVAERGAAVLASGEAITLDFDASSKLTGIVVTASDVASLIENRHAIETPDGQIIMSAQSVSTLRGSLVKNSGTLIANEGASSISHKGGRILLEGDEVTLNSTSVIEVKGSQGGGTVLVGGDWQGSHGVYQASQTTQEAGATIDAGATVNGDGGKVVLWSDVHNAASLTTAVGSIKAEGGALGGNGGQIETSGHKLAVDGIAVSTKAAQGATGKWLLDPYNITISGADSNTSNTSGAFTASADSSTIAASTLIAALGGSGVEVSTAGAGGTQAGDITVASAITSTSGNSLMLRADGAVAVNAPISLTGGFEVVAHGNVGLNTTTASHVYVNTSGDISDGGVLTTPHLQLIGRDILFSQTHAVGSLAASGRSIAFRNGTALTVGSESTTLVGGSTGTTNGVSASGSARTASNDPLQGYVILETLAGNLTIDGPVTSNQGSFSGQYLSPGTFQSVLGVKVAEPIYLLAGSGSAAGTSTGGNIVFGANAAVSTTGIGKILLFTGSVAGTSVSGQVAGNTRYSLDKSFLDYGGYTPGLGNSLGARLTPDNGISVLYRESPNVTITGQNVTVTYGDVTNPNIPMGDVAVGGATYTASAPGAAWYGSGPTIAGIDPSMQPSMPMTLTTSAEQYSSAYRLKVGTYTLTTNVATGLNASYGFTVTSSTNGSLTVDQKVIDPQFIVTDRYYDGTTNVPAGNITVNGVIPLSGTYDNSGSGNGGGIMGNRLDGLSLSYTASYANQNVQYDNNNAPAAQAVTFGNFVLGGQSLYSRWADDSANYRVLSPSVTTQSKVLPRPITVDASLSKTYDGTTVATLTGANYSINNVVSGEGISLTSTETNRAAVYASADAGTQAITVDNYNPTGDLVFTNGANPLNYALPSTVTGNGTISPKQLTLNFAPTYNTTTSFDGAACSTTVICSDFTLSGFVNADHHGAIYTNSGGTTVGLNVNSANVADNATNYITSLGNLQLKVDLTGGTNHQPTGNYIIQAGSQSTAPVTINPFGVTVVVTGGDRIYDATTALPAGANLGLGIVALGDTASDIYLNAAGATYATADVGSNKALAFSGNPLAGPKAGNYVIAGTSGSAAVYAIPLSSISGTKSWDSTTNFTNAQLSYTSSLSEALTFTSLTTGSSNPGTQNSVTGYTLTNAAGHDVTGNYTLPNAGNISLTTGKIPINLSAASSNTVWYKVYNGATDTTTGTGELLSGYEGVSGNSFLAYKGIGALSPYIAGNSAYSLSGTATGNAIFTIKDAVDQQSLTSTMTTAMPISSANFSFTGALDSGNAGARTLTLTPTLTGAAAQWYQLGSSPSFTVNAAVGKIPLPVTVDSSCGALGTCTAGPQSKVYDGTANAVTTNWRSTVTNTGVLAGDSIGNLALTAKFLTSNTAPETESPGAGSKSYILLSGSFDGANGANYLAKITQFTDPIRNVIASPVTASTTASGYIFTPSSGTLFSITGIPVLLSASKMYDGTTVYSLSDISIVSASTGAVIPGLSLQNSDPSLHFYVGTFVAGSGTGPTDAGGTMTPAPDVATLGKQLFFPKQLTSTSPQISLANTLTLTGANSAGYQINWGSVASLAEANAKWALADANYYRYYNLSAYMPGTTATIIPATVTITGNLTGAISKIYDGTQTAVLAPSNFNLIGWATGDGATVTKATGTYSDSNVGASKAVSVTLSNGDYSATGSTNLGNYTLPSSLTGDIGEITVRPINITANSGQGKIYGNVDPLLTYALEANGTNRGLVGSDSFSGALARANGENVGSGYAINQGTLANGNYAISFTGDNFAVTQRPINITANSGQSKIYGDADPSLIYAVEANGTDRGLVGSDTFSGALGRAAGTNVGSYVINQGTLDNSNYAVSLLGGATFTINPANAVVTGNSSTVTYNGSAQSVAGYAVSGLVNGETASVLSSVAAAGASGTNAGSYSNAVSGNATDGNYNLTFTDGALTIGKAALTVTASAASKTYDGQAYSGGNGAGYSGFVNGETSAVLGGSLSYGGSSQGAVNAGSYAITPSGLSSGNYTISYGDGALSVGRANATVTGNSSTVTYNGLAQSVTGYVVSGLVNSETASVLSSVSAAGATGTNAGSFGNAVSGNATDGNYNLSFADGALTINRANATVTGNSGTVTYNGLAQSVAGYAVSGLVNSETASVLSSVSAAGATGTNAGSYINAVSGNATDGNYNLTLADGGLTVNKAPLTVAASNASKTYDGLAYSGGNGVGYTGFVNGEASAVLGGSLSYGGSSQGAVSAGSYAITPGGLSSANYTISYGDGALSVGRANATVTGNSSSVTYNGQAHSVAGYAVSGLVNSETAAVLGSVTAAGATATNAGSYSNVVSGNATDGNYNLTLVDGTLAIAKAALLVTGASHAATYNGLAQTNNGASYSGNIAGENFTISGYGSGTNASGTPYADNLSVAAGSGTLLSNYTVSYSNGGLTISPATLSYTATPATSTYGATPVVTGTVLGLQNGESLGSVTTGTPTFSTTATALSDVGSYAINGAGLTLTSGDYVLASAPANSTALTINPATLSYTATPVASTYGSTPVVTGTVSGLQNGESLASVTTGTPIFSTTATPLSNVGTYAVDATGLTLTSANYVLASAPVNSTALTINPATLSYTATFANSTYGATPTVAGTVSGMQNGEALASVTTGTAAFSTAATAQSNVGSYAIDGSGLTLTSGNYVLASAPANSTALTINPATLSYTAPTITSTYGSTPAVTGGTVTGLQNGQQLADVTTGTATFSTTATALSDVGSYAIDGNGLALTSGNYVFAQTPANSTALTINPATLSYTAPTITSIFGSTPAVSGGTVVGLQNGQQLADVATGTANFSTTATALSNVGSYAIDGAGLSLTSSNYVFAQAPANTNALTIAPKALTVTGANTTVTYNGLAQSNSGASYSGQVGSDNFTISGYGSGTHVSGTPYADNLSVTAGNGTLLSNYTVSYSNGGLTVDKAPLTVTGVNNTVTYNGTAQSNIGAAYSGNVAGESFTINGYGSGTNASGTPYADNLSVTAGNGTLLSNYNPSYTNGALTINRANATVTGNSSTVTYNGVAQSVTGYAVSGLVNAEAASVLTGVSAAGASGTNAGSYSNAVFGNATNGNYSLTFVDGTLAISRAPLTVNGLAVTNKAYDGASTAMVDTSAISYSGLIGSDQVIVNVTGADFSSADVGTHTVLLTSSNSGTSAGNYDIVAPGSLTGNITPKPLTISGLAASGKTYDGATTAAVTNWGNVSTGVGAETLVLNGGTANFADANAGNAKTVTATGYSLADGANGGMASNYVLSSTSSTTTADIAQKSLTIGGLTANAKTYDGTAAATVANWGSVNTGVGGETLVLNHGTASFANANAGAGKTVTSTGYSLADGNNVGLASNYVLSSASSTTTADITQKALTVLGQGAASKTYDGGNVASLSGGSLLGVIGSEDVTLSQAGTFNSANAGTAIGVTAANGLIGAGASNYSLTQPTGLAADILAKPVTITGLVASNKVYDGTAAATVGNWGAVATGVGGETLVLNHGTASFVDANAGTGKTVTATGYTLSDGTGLASNYVLGSTTATTTSDIAPKSLTVTGVVANAKTYDGSTVTSMANWGNVSTGVGTETLVVNGGTASFADANAGTGKTVTASGYTLADGTGQASNYVLTSTSATTAADIAPKSLAITGVAANSKTYDGNAVANMANWGSVNTDVGAETLTLNTGTASFADANAGAGKTVSATGYSLSDGTGLASNYVLGSTTATTTADIAPKSVTVTGVVANSKVYDGTTVAALASWGGVSTGVGAETLVVNGGTASFADANAGTGKTVTASGYTLADGTGQASNYVLTSTSATTAADIAPKSLAITGVAANSKTYDGNAVANMANWGSVNTDVGAETLTLNTGTASFADANAGAGKTVSATGYSLSDGTGLASNYVLGSTTATTTADIAPKSVTVTGVVANSKVYDGTTVAALASWGGVSTGVGAETLVVSGGTANFADANAGTTKAVTASGYSLADGSNGGLASNYVLSNSTTATTADITPKSLTVASQGAANKTYDGTTLATLNGGALVGLVGNDAVTLQQAGAFASPDAGVGVGVVTANTIGGAAAGNYTVVQPSGITANITKAPLTITAADASKPYDGIAYAGGNGVAYAGFVNAETVTALEGNLGYAGSSQGAINGGNYSIVPTGLNARNYEISFVNGQLTINAVTTASPDTINFVAPSNVFGVAATTAPGATQAEMTLDDVKKVVADPNGVRVVYVGNPDGTQQALQAIALMKDDSTPLPEMMVDDLLTSSNLMSETNDKTKKSGNQLLSYRAMKLPEQAQITTVLANDEPLPTNLVFNSNDKTFTINKDAALSLPIQVKIQLRQGGSVVSEKIVMLMSGGG